MASSPRDDEVRAKVPTGFFALTYEEQLAWARTLVRAIKERKDHEKEADE